MRNQPVDLEQLRKAATEKGWTFRYGYGNPHLWVAERGGKTNPPTRVFGSTEQEVLLHIKQVSSPLSVRARNTRQAERELPPLARAVDVATPSLSTTASPAETAGSVATSAGTCCNGGCSRCVRAIDYLGEE